MDAILNCYFANLESHRTRMSNYIIEFPLGAGHRL